MIGFYYRVWVDCIVSGKQQPANKQNWAAGSMIFMSMAMSFNLVMSVILLQKYAFGYYFYKLNFSFLPAYASNLFSYIILFILPCVLINYLLIYRNKKYEKLLKKYPYYNGKLFVTYFLISMFLPIVLMWVGIIFS